MAQRGFGSRRRLCAVLAAAVGMASGGVRGDVVGSGDVVPTDPGTWTSATTGNVGNTSAGSVTVTAGSMLYSSVGYLGNGAGSSGTVDVSGAGSTWTNGSTLTIGKSGVGSLGITGGGAVSDGVGLLGYNAGASGTVTVDGSGSNWRNAGSVSIGHSGSGAVSVTNGGNFSGSSYTYLGYNANATGSVMISGPSTGWICGSSFYVGRSGNGSLTVANGGQLNVGGDGDVGRGAGSTGYASVDGIGSMWTNGGNLYVGNAGKGTLSISNGGIVTNTWSGYIGASAGAAGLLLVDGVGSQWSDAGNCYVGRSGNGTLSITNGAATIVAGGTSSIGCNSGSYGRVNVDGTGSTWSSSGALFVGQQGSGVLNISNGGLVKVGGIVYVATSSTATGAIDFGANGGTLSCLALNASRSQLTGTGTINVHGLLADFELDAVIDAEHGPIPVIGLTGANQNITINLDLTGGDGAVSDLTIGNAGPGNLVVKDGYKAAAANTYVGAKSTAVGIMSIDGTSSTWTNSGSLYVGQSGSGTFLLTNGAKATGAGSKAYIGQNASSSGLVSVDGAGSVWSGIGDMNVGGSGTGTLSITNGGLVNSSGDTYVSVATYSAGTALIDGSGSKWTVGGFLRVGSGGHGTLRITNGGQVDVDGMFASASPYAVPGTGMIDFGINGGTLTCKVLCSGSDQFMGNGTIITRGLYGDFDLLFDRDHGATQTINWNGTGENVAVLLDASGHGGIVGDMGIGTSMNGTMVVRDGVMIVSSRGDVAYNKGSTGSVTVDGPGSMWTINSILNVSLSGTGSLTISNGGRVNVKGPTWLVAKYGPNGRGTGQLIFGAGGGTLTTWSFYGATSQVIGSGMIVTCGVISDGSLIFDAAHGLQQTTRWNGPGQDVAVDFDLSGARGSAEAFGMGAGGMGTLTITDGVTVPSGEGYLGFLPGSTSFGVVTGTGSTWVMSSDLYVGNAGYGNLEIRNGGAVSNVHGWVANSNHSTGSVVVDGSGSTWTNTGGLDIGYLGGNGTVTITNQGCVNVLNSSCNIGATNGYGAMIVDGTGSSLSAATVTIGSSSYGSSGPGWAQVFDSGLISTGALNVVNGTLSLASGGSVVVSGVSTVRSNAVVDGNGSLWTSTGSLSLSGGTLLITNGGMVKCPMATVGSSSSGGAVSVDGAGSQLVTSGSLTVGAVFASGTMSITNGGYISSGAGSLGGQAASYVYVDGVGSIWNVNGSLNMGGVLKLTHGGQVISSQSSTIGNGSNLNLVLIDGAGSKWKVTGSLSVLSSCNISNGGNLSAVGITNGGLFGTVVGDGSVINAGNNYFTNNGTLRLKMAPNLTAGSYTPITAGWWSGYGTVQALGGSWNNATHVVTVSAAANGTTGQAMTINRLQTQRVMITNPTAGDCVWAGVLPTTSSSNMTLTARGFTEGEMGGLWSKVAAGQSVLDGWWFATSGYSSSDPAYLSMKVGGGQGLGDLAVWRYDGTTWAKYTTYDLTYDGTYASFTVTGFSGYAVTGVPEPASLAVLALGMVGMLRRRRRNRK